MAARAFERKHYRKIASVVSETAAEYDSVIAQRIVRHVAVNLANMLAADAPQFDRERFLVAAGFRG